MRRIGLVGCGNIGAPVIRAIQSGQGGNSCLVAVLSRTEKTIGDLVTTVDIDKFFNSGFDLLIDTANGHWLRAHGARALGVANVWTVNASALSEPEVFQNLEQAGKQHGNRLRVVTGAIAGLDGVATACVDPEAEVVSAIDVAPSAEPRTILFQGSATEAARQFPESVNVAVAAAIAGPGPDKMRTQVVRPNIEDGRKLSLSASSKFGDFESRSIPRVIPGELHTVSASIIAALQREDQVIWVG